ncbi:MAG: cupin domain-containing protein [Mucilaginibacter sp.]
MDIKQYIANGVLEDFSLGLLSEEESVSVIEVCRQYPEIAAELIDIENALEKYAVLHAIPPSDLLRLKVLKELGFDETLPALDLNNLPVTNSRANHLQWLEALKHLIPEDPAEDVFAAPLTNTPQLAQTLVVTKCDVPEETHGDLIESFFILKGECICEVGNELHHLHAGSFLEIPLHTTHTIKIVSPYVVGILQHRMLEV